MSAETVVYNGKKYRRYPNAKGLSDRRYFKRTINGGTQTEYLHHAVWRDNCGEIPAGYHIHHKDHNPANNDIGNLVCMPASEHLSEHMQRREPDLEHLGRIRPLTVEWHRSEEGRAWHSEHGKQTWVNRQPLHKNCDQCGSGFESMGRRDSDRFCSNNCKSAWRRSSGIDNETRTCGGCGSDFIANKYSDAKSCSRKCAWIIRKRS